MIYLAVSIEYRRVTDRQTDGRTSCDNIVRAICIASGSDKMASLAYLVTLWLLHYNTIYSDCSLSFRLVGLVVKLGHMKISRRNAITGTNPYCWTLTDPRGGIILNKYFMTVYAITDTKKGRTGIAPILIFKLPVKFIYVLFLRNKYDDDDDTLQPNEPYSLCIMMMAIYHMRGS